MTSKDRNSEGWELAGTNSERLERERKEKRRNEILVEALAASSAGEVGSLRMALAEILVAEDKTRSYSIGSCGCSGRGCRGHVPETTKIARAALGLPPLPDNDRVPCGDGLVACHKVAPRRPDSAHGS